MPLEGDMFVHRMGHTVIFLVQTMSDARSRYGIVLHRTGQSWRADMGSIPHGDDRIILSKGDEWRAHLSSRRQP